MQNRHYKLGAFHRVAEHLFCYSVTKKYYAVFKCNGKTRWISLKTTETCGLEEPLVHLTLAPAGLGRRVVAAIELLMCTDQDYVRRKSRDFEFFTLNGKEHSRLLQRKPDRKHWSNVIKRLEASKLQGVQANGKDVAELFEKTGRETKESRPASGI